ncbi:MAG: hypothetical protein HWE34_04750 [Methylocystaceae bacterium]|nr:hypothetical protein [Methylocystaceae bacterium]
MLNIIEIRQKVSDLGTRIKAPRIYSAIPDMSSGDGTPHVEIIEDEYHYVTSERGSETSRKVTKEIDQLLFWIFEDIIFSMANSFELKNRIQNKDSRRLYFTKEIELFKQINPKWVERKKKKIESILKSVPYDDDADKRVELCIKLTNSGYSSENAYEKACEKYPLPIPDND